MSVTNVQKDTEELTMTFTAEYDVTADRAWQLWADPRQLERWWGPPTYPATFEDHDPSTGEVIESFPRSGAEDVRQRPAGEGEEQLARAGGYDELAVS